MRRPAGEDLAVRPDRAAHADRAERHRHGDLLPEHVRVELAVRDVGHHPFAEADRLEVAAIFRERDLGERSVLDIFHEGPRHAAVGAAAQILDARDRVGRLPHSSPLAAMPAMRSPMRQASAWMVSDGLTPPTGREQRAVADPEIRDVPGAAVGVGRRCRSGSSPIRQPPIRCAVSSSASTCRRAPAASAPRASKPHANGRSAACRCPSRRR